ncbi:hypothetical protein Hanom_Chr07g00643721 [Helianthus anomalus]
MDGVNEPDENGKISNLLDPDAEKQTFARKLQTSPNFREKQTFPNCLLSYHIHVICKW